MQSDDNRIWHHVAISYDGNELTIYIDNVSTKLGALKGTVLVRTILGWGNSRSKIPFPRSMRSQGLRVTSSVSTTEPFSTHDVTLGDVDASLFHIKI